MKDDPTIIFNPTFFAVQSVLSSRGGGVRDDLFRNTLLYTSYQMSVAQTLRMALRRDADKLKTCRTLILTDLVKNRVRGEEKFKTYFLRSPQNGDQHWGY